MSNTSEKIGKIGTIEGQVHKWKEQGLTIVFTNGCFDIIHLGHIDYLEKASDLGDILVVGLNSDSSVKRLKGDSRPVNDEYSRARMLAALSFVDAVIYFDDDTPYDIIRVIEPDILVKGGDYMADEMDPESPNYIIGADIVINNGGQVKTIKLVDGYSTSAIIEKIKNLNN